jgi:hypothetical protein
MGLTEHAFEILHTHTHTHTHTHMCTCSIYWKELAYIIIEADKYHNLLDE